MTRIASLPRLDVHKTNNTPNRQTAALDALPDLRARVSHNGMPLLENKGHLPTIPEAEHTPHDSLKALPFSSLATVPLLPIVNRSSQEKAQLGWTETQVAAQSRPDALRPEPSSEPSRVVVSRPVPHYAIPQDRTPLWSERNRPGRFTTPENPYKQNLDIAPKLKQGANRFSTPAWYGRAYDFVPATSLQSRSPRQQGAQGLDTRHLAPLTASDLTHAGSLQQASTIQLYHTVHACTACHCYMVVYGCALLCNDKSDSSRCRFRLKTACMRHHTADVTLWSPIGSASGISQQQA